MDLTRSRELAQWYLSAYRAQARAAWYLRRARAVGQAPHVGGAPTVEATDLEIGDRVTIWSGHRQTLISGWGPIRIGDRCLVNSGSVLFSAVGLTIGDDVAIANEVYITDTNSHGVEGRPVVEAPVSIGSGTWVGARAMVLPGVSIGRRVLVAAGSVVTRDVPDDVLVAGNPARVVRSLSYPPHCRRAWHDEELCPCPAPTPAAGPVPA